MSDIRKSLRKVSGTCVTDIPNTLARTHLPHSALWAG